MPETFLLSLLLAMFLVVALLSAAGAAPARELGRGDAGRRRRCWRSMPGVPAITLDPDLTLLALLPPLLYYSGVGMSWRGFRSNLRPILSLAIGCVLFTASAVAAVAHYVLGLSWAAGFVLGAIVSPPNSVAPASLRRRFKLPRRLLTILEGESLANDATALVTFSLAVRAVETSQFSPTQAVLQFVVIVAGEIGFGCALGFLVLRLRNAVADPKAAYRCPTGLQSNIEYRFYKSGHMVYVQEASLKALHDNVADFIRRTGTPAPAPVTGKR